MKKRWPYLIGSLSPLATAWLGAWIWNEVIPPYQYGNWRTGCMIFDFCACSLIGFMVWVYCVGKFFEA